MRIRPVFKPVFVLQAGFIAYALCGTAFAEYAAGMDALGVKNYARARVEFESEPENPKSAYQLARMAQFGLGEPKNSARRAGLLKRAADLGLVAAKFEWALALGNGIGVDASPNEAITILESLEGHAEAMVYLSRLYRYGWWGIPADPVRSASLLKAASEAGSMWATGLYGKALIYADGVTADPAQGVSLLKKAVDAGDPDAEFEYATLLTFGGAGVTVDAPAGVALFRRVGERGEARAQLAVCQAHLSGEGVLRDPEAALRWCDAAARQGNPWAQVKLGDMFRLGRGVPRLPAQAYFWYTLASTSNFSIGEEARQRRAEIARGLRDEEIQRQAKRAAAFQPQHNLRVRVQTLPPMSRDDRLTLGSVEIAVPAPEGYMNGWEIVEYLRRVSPNDPDMRPLRMMFALQEDISRSKLGISGPMRTVEVEAYGGDEEVVTPTLFADIRKQIRQRALEVQQQGQIKMDQVRDDDVAYAYIRSSMTGSNAVDAFAFVHVRSRVVALVFTGFDADRMAELRSLVEKTAAEISNRNGRGTFRLFGGG
jgi:TPR repeat protein